ncbi:MAG: response regulator transcription factor [Bacteriovorax sp.]
MKKILVVEDDTSIRELLIEILEDEGYCVSSSTNGSEGLKALELSIPDLIIMDIMMPVMDGYSFRKELLKNATWNAIPVLAMSAQAQSEQKLELHGFANFINKPLELNHLLETVSALA